MGVSFMDQFSIEMLEAILRNHNFHPKLHPGLGLYHAHYAKYGSMFWGFRPSSGVSKFTDLDIDFTNFNVLDLGAGTGKNSFEFVRKGANRIVSVEVDSIAIRELTESIIRLEDSGYLPEGKVVVYKEDAVNYLRNTKEVFDCVVSYGLIHVFKSQQALSEIIFLTQEAVKLGGYLILQSLTNKYSAPLSQPELEGIIVTNKLLDHYFSPIHWETIFFDDSDIEHSHIGSEEVNHKHGAIRVILKKREE